MAPEISALRIVKLLHTVVWAVFAGCIVAIPYFAWRRRLDTAAVLIAIVTIEVAVLIANRMRRTTPVRETEMSALIDQSTRDGACRSDGGETGQSGNTQIVLHGADCRTPRPVPHS